MTEDERSVWEKLVPVIVHPLKVIALEALEWIQEPLSASDLKRMLDEEGIELSLISYHLGKLAEAGVIELQRTRRVRGATERFYGFV